MMQNISYDKQTQIDNSCIGSSTFTQTNIELINQEISVQSEMLDKETLYRPFMQNVQIQNVSKSTFKSTSTLIESQDSITQTNMRNAEASICMENLFSV